MEKKSAYNKEPIIIPLSKFKLMLMFLGSLGFVALGVGFVWSPSTFDQFAFDQIFITVIGTASVLFFGTCAFFILRKLAESKPGLIINQEGITDDSSAVANGLILWRDITNIRIVEVSRQKIIMIHVLNPESYVNSASSTFKRKMLQLNYKMYGTPLSLSSNGLKCSFEELYQLVLSTWKANQRKEYFNNRSL
jgi:hypothetical protein